MGPGRFRSRRTRQSGTEQDTAAAGSCDVVPTDGDKVVIGAETLTINDGVAIRNLPFTGGTLDGTGDLAVGSTFVWEAGTMAGAGTTTMAGSASLLASTFKNVVRRIVLRGTTTWSNGTTVMRVTSRRVSTGA